MKRGTVVTTAQTEKPSVLAKGSRGRCARITPIEYEMTAAGSETRGESKENLNVAVGDGRIEAMSQTEFK
jgi:hypothetical protein